MVTAELKRAGDGSPIEATKKVEWARLIGNDRPGQALSTYCYAQPD